MVTLARGIIFPPVPEPPFIPPALEFTRRQIREQIETPREFPREVAGAAFVSPGVPPAIQRALGAVPTVPPAGGAGATAARVTLGGLGAIIGAAAGFIAAEFLRTISQQRLEESFAALLAPDPFVPGDTPLIVERPQPIEEIVVTATRLEQLRALSPLTLPPLPQFQNPDPDFVVIQPFIPAVQPRPTLPDVEISTPTLPEISPRPQVEIPQRSPFVIPLTQPVLDPATRPQTEPRVAPSPATRPLTEPQPRVVPLPRTRGVPRTAPRPRTLPRTRTLPSPFAQPGRRPDRCPPCPKKKPEEDEKPRTRCFKKLVKEGLFPDLDQEFEWVQIDCLTGREIGG